MKLIKINNDLAKSIDNLDFEKDEDLNKVIEMLN